MAKFKNHNTKHRIVIIKRQLNCINMFRIIQLKGITIYLHSHVVGNSREKKRTSDWQYPSGKN